MNRTVVFIAVLMVLLLLTLGMWFSVTGPALSTQNPDTAGKLFFQVLLVGDCLFLMMGFFLIRRCHPAATPARPLWQRPVAAADDQVPGYAGWLVLCLVLATVLRVYKLNTDIWMDEVFTLVDSVRQPLWFIFSSYSDDNQHTLLSILANLSISAFGEHAWTLRLPAVVFGIASVWVVARLAELVFGQRVALCSALLLAVSYHHIWFSQNARGYTMLLVATVLSLEMLLRGLQSAQWRYWVVYALAIAVGAWAHLTGVFIAIAHGLVLVGWFILQPRSVLQGGWKALLALMLSAWITLHCYGLALPDIYDFYLHSGSVAGWEVEWTSPWWLVTEVLSRLGIEGVAVWGVLAVAIPVGLACAVYLWMRAPLFFAFGIAPAVFTGMVMLALGRNLWPRMFFNEAGFVVICIVVLLLALGDLFARLVSRYSSSPLLARVGVWSLPVLLVLVSIASLPGLYRYPKQAYSAARDFVRERAAEDDRVLVLHMAGRVYSQYYAPEWIYVNSPEEVSITDAAQGTTWLLYTLPAFVHGAMPDIATVLQSDYDFVEEFPGTLGDGEIVVLRSKKATTQ